MSQKGTRSVKGKGEKWQETKSKKLTVQLTPTGWAGVKSRAIEFGLSVAEVFERFGRGLNLFGNNDAIDESAIIKTLARLSNESLKRIADAVVELLYERCGLPMGRPEKLITKPTIASLISENWEQCQILIEGDCISDSRLEALKSGDRPTDEELSFLVSCLDSDFDELNEIRRENDDALSPNSANLY